MNRNPLLALFVLFAASLFAQTDTLRPGLPAFVEVSVRNVSASTAELTGLSLFAVLGENALENRNVDDRLGAAQALTDSLTVFLSNPGSFLTALDSIKNAVVVYPQDSSFRTITWQIYINEDEYRQFGLVQTAQDLVYVLTDGSDLIEDPMNEPTSASQWYGALYYDIKDFETSNGQKYYTLFGLDNHSYWARRKVMDVMRLTESGPVFDQPMIIRDSIGQKYYRDILEYSSASRATFKFDEEQQIVIFDYLALVPASPEAGGAMFVPDGTYEGYELKKDGWHYISKLKVTEMETAPTPVPLNHDDSDRDVFGKKKKKKRH
jgi:hypothetical protein